MEYEALEAPAPGWWDEENAPLPPGPEPSAGEPSPAGDKPPQADEAPPQEDEAAQARFREEHMLRADGTVDPTPLSWNRAAGLLGAKLRPIRYFVEGLLPQGLALLAAPPKYGKSWLALDLCVSVARGAPFLGRETERADTLYLALEDSPNRLQMRLAAVLGGDAPPDGLFYGTAAGTIGDRLLHQLAVHLHRWPDTGLVVIDTFQKVRDGSRAGADIYARDYRDVGALKQFADAHGICILLVHHLRKAGDAADPFARISGTNGLLGAADTALVMTRDERQDDITTLSATGRDVVADDISMRFDQITARWQPVADPRAQSREARYRADPVVIAACALAASSPGGWQGTASEFCGYLFEQTGAELSSRSVSSRLRSLAGDLLRYDGILYSPPSDSSAGRRVHTLYKKSI